MNAAKANRVGVSLVFLIHGLVTGLWCSHIPWIQGRLAVNNGQFSLALLAGTLGAFPGLFFSGALTRRFGSRTLILVTMTAYCVVLPLLFFAPGIGALSALLAANGLFLGSMDVSMNTRASSTEKACGKSIMSNIHAFWSFAGLVAAGLAKAAFSLGLPTNVFILVSAALLLCLGFFAVSLMKPLPDDSVGIRQKSPAGAVGSKQKIFMFPKGPLVVVAAITTLAFISEGAIYDWGALFLNKVRRLDVGTAALGYGGFSFLMALGRGFGDSVTRRLGQKKTVALSSVFAACSLAMAVLIPVPALSLAFVALTGLGMANIVPILFSIAGKSAAMPVGMGISSVSTVAYAGFMIGPPLMGFVADRGTLALSMVLILSLSIVIAAASLLLLKDDQSHQVRPT